MQGHLPVDTCLDRCTIFVWLAPQQNQQLVKDHGSTHFPSTCQSPCHLSIKGLSVLDHYIYPFITTRPCWLFRISKQTPFLSNMSSSYIPKSKYYVDKVINISRKAIKKYAQDMQLNPFHTFVRKLFLFFYWGKLTETLQWNMATNWSNVFNENLSIQSESFLAVSSYSAS